MYLFTPSLPNTLRDTRSDLKNEAMASVDDYMEERQKGEDTPDEATLLRNLEEGSEFDEDGYEDGYEDGSKDGFVNGYTCGYEKASEYAYRNSRVETLKVLAYLTISCISIYILR